MATTLSAAAGASHAAGAEPRSEEFYELRAYSLPAAKQPMLDRYLSKSFLPALKRYGIGPVGVFLEKEEAGKGPPKVFVLIVHPSAESVVTLAGRLAADEDHRKSAAEYLAVPATEPVYTRIDSSLLRRSQGCLAW